MSNPWNAKLVEELLFRQYEKGEDVSMLLPPPPALSVDQYLKEYEQSTKVLFAYVRNGPANALTPQNINNPRMYGGTPTKGSSSMQRTGNQGGATCATTSSSSACGVDSKAQMQRHPRGLDGSQSAAPSLPLTAGDAAAGQGSMAPPEHIRKRIEWPATVPTNSALKSNSRSRVANLTTKRVAAQERVDPDLIFMQNPEELPLHTIFAKYPKAVESIAALRGGSGDWREDTFTEEEEILYKRELRYSHMGPSQCGFFRSNLIQRVTATTGAVPRDEYRRQAAEAVMPYPLGSSLWVKCDDGEWWPATVREVETELLLSMGSEYDTCIEFYHDPGNFYPLDSTSGGVRLLHLAVEERDKDEQRLFNVSATKEAVRRLLEERSGTPTASPTEDSQPYSAAEMRYMRSLVDSVSPDSAAVMQNSLKQEGVNISRRNIRRVARKERSSKSKVSRSRTSVEERSTVRLTSSLGSTQSSKSTNPTPPLSCGRSSSSWRRRSGGRGGVEVYGECVFQEAVDAATLDVLRAEVFGNPDRFVLSPLYRFLDVLGAVSVEGESIETTLPSPAAVNEEPPQGFSPSRRVLLVPLSSSSYNHTDGWLESFEFENKRIAMELFVNGLKVVTPPNPSVPSGRESVAVKTTPVADITEMVSGKELFSLRVHFTGLMEDATLWEGYIVAVYVERTGVDLLAERIVSNYHSSPAQREVEGVVDVQVRAVCPITALPLSVPVRACGCEHVQCIELQAVLMHCDRTNVWNCPLCWAPMTPETIAVNYRLKEWLDSNRSRVNKVDFIVETPPGRNLNVVWRKNEPRKIDNIETLE